MLVRSIKTASDGMVVESIVAFVSTFAGIACHPAVRCQLGPDALLCVAGHWGGKHAETSAGSVFKKVSGDNGGESGEVQGHLPGRIHCFQAEDQAGNQLVLRHIQKVTGDDGYQVRGSAYPFPHTNAVLDMIEVSLDCVTWLSRTMTGIDELGEL